MRQIESELYSKIVAFLFCGAPYLGILVINLTRIIPGVEIHDSYRDKASGA